MQIGPGGDPVLTAHSCQAFSQGGVLNSPLVKAGLVGLAGIIGSRMLRR